MKKTAVIILAAAMAMGLTACSGFSAEEPAATTKAGTTETTAAGTQAEEKTQAQAGPESGGGKGRRVYLCRCENEPGRILKGH